MKKCTQCPETKEESQFYYKANSKSILRSECKVCTNKINCLRQIENKEKRNAYKKKWAKAHPEAGAQAGKNWRSNNKDAANALTAKRRAARIQRTPKWLNKAQLIEIKQFYVDAAYLTYYTNTPFEVDHIVPLRGALVSGLHVPWNLQIVTEFENRSWGNQYDY